MIRISYVPANDQGPEQIVGPIRSRRGGNLLKMDRIMLHSAPFAAAWNVFFGAINNELVLDRKIREFIMCAIAALNHAGYEMLSHAPKFIAAGGTRDQLDALGDVEVAVQDEKLFDPAERAILRLAVEMTRNIEVAPATFAAAQAAVGTERELVELIGVIAAYNMVSRFVVAIGLEDDGHL
jgi:alkylhydroperoxidase family enzyme